MAFSKTDIYTSSGSTPLYNAWTPYVSKFDTSTFYNWEQDNLPLYDLEERTYELWEQGGFATSAGVPGLALTVSGDAAASVFETDRTIFSDLSSAIAAIPKVVRFPVLVEVANFGTKANLGPLELHNFRIEEGGSIEIVNRAFSRAYTAGLTVSALAGSVVPTPANNQTNPLVGVLSSLDITNTLNDASAVHLSASLLSSTTDVRLDSSAWSCLYPRQTLVKSPLSVNIATTGFRSGTANQYTITPYEQVTNAIDTSMSTKDISATNSFTELAIKRQELSLNDPVGGTVYLNRLTKISVKNCDGPVYIRNFFVDGETQREVGIEINNSDVVLENCAATRAQEAGWKFNNSKVVLSRSAFAYRNYKLNTPSTRKDDVGYGFHAINSEVTVSSNPQAFDTTGAVDAGASGCDCTIVASRNYAGFVLENSKLVGGISRVDGAVAEQASVISSELNTGPGMLLRNSSLTTSGLVDVYANDVGIESTNTKFDFEYLCLHANQKVGVSQKTSDFLFYSEDSPGEPGQADRFQLEFSGNGQHIVLDNNSSFGFRKTSLTPRFFGNTKLFDSHGIADEFAGVSVFSDLPKIALPAVEANNGSQLSLLSPYLIAGETTPNVPCFGRAIKADKQSTVSLFGTKNGCSFLFGSEGYSKQKHVAGVYAKDNSTINIHGPTAIGQYGVDILVEDNSILNIEPHKESDGLSYAASEFELNDVTNHTSVELHATRACIVADKGSTVNLNDLGSYPANWLRSTEGVEYLNFGVDYNVEDTSAFTKQGSLQFYPAPQDSNAITDNFLDDITNTGGDALSFALATFPKFVSLDGINRFFITDQYINVGSYAYNNEPKITLGGTCLRAVQGSVVNVNNVHFPVSPNGSPLDGKYYNVSGDDCSRFGIWNIADTSRLNASYLSVSGLHPISTVYHGPSAVWVSSYDGTGSIYAASGAPSSTPDTGSLSVLDAFGAGSSIWMPTSGVSVNSDNIGFFPVSGDLNAQVTKRLVDAGISVSALGKYNIGAQPGTSNNRGVFRLYWTPESSARYLQSDVSGYIRGAYPHNGGFSGVVGPPYQLFSQGYNCSAPLSAVIPIGLPNVSSIAPNLLKISYASGAGTIPNTLWTSGFYYCNEFLEDNPTQCMLDEAAADTFANAKNASVGLSNTPKRVTLYRSRSDSVTNKASESYTGDPSGSLGFKSAGIFDLKRDN